MKKTNIILIIAIILLTIGLLFMTRLYLDMKKSSEIGLNGTLQNANLLFEANKRIEELEKELEVYKNNDTKLVNVTIEVLENTITDKSVEILITDNSENKCAWEEKFAVQEKVNEEWINLSYISDDIDWNLMAYCLDENNQLKQKLNIEAYYGKLDKGTYRIVKTKWNDDKEFDIYSNEFELK